MRTGAAGEIESLPALLDVLAHQQGSSTPVDDAAAAIETMVLHPDYPCLGARSVFNRERARVVVLDDLGTERSARALIPALAEFAAQTDLGDGFASLVSVFRCTRVPDETSFEELLWRQLELIHDHDELPWNPQVSDDPDNPHFAFSVAGTAYFVVGLHPRASRIARRTPLPTLVFNLHEQFERLRGSARFERMRDTIRRRDEALQGTVNPMVDDYGCSSEARQYSGRLVSRDWHPPAHFDHEERQ
ncbi:guanitoxin biosynthesis heme-dependent pre-guanitoxin N-hydroxylase GntA [Pedococcus sp. 5OH_020]|uniref:guanitoxin biosynthesis heme-dependent pre-guanitoxin N-hydroxylase GntA n=1 Tax=Pedococcus sp. 5OH_020 TaxID=2989814 RepID=UPI0022E9A73A|nr:guanitoxin biosynthesis heme-dependent pre-guanitoxin N-hydroxylase GntA [Pedococcus sp. 5OH_020]